MSLKEEMNAIDEKVASQVPAEDREVMHKATEMLANSGIAEKAVGVGDKAPLFALPNQRGETVRLEDLLASGPVVLSFYRGKW